MGFASTGKDQRRQSLCDHTVIRAATLVVKENTRLQLIIDSDLSDVLELEDGARDGARDGPRIGAQQHSRR